MLEENMDIWRRWTERKARRAGEVQALQRVLLRMLRKRFGPVPATIRKGIAALTSTQNLDELVDRALTVRSLEEMRFG